MTTRSGRGRWQRVLDARDQAQLALGDAHTRADKPPKPGPVPQDIHKRKAAPYVPGRTEIVLTVGDAARRLHMSRDELEAMIDAGTVEALPTDFTRMIAITEVDRLSRR